MPAPHPPEFRRHAVEFLPKNELIVANANSLTRIATDKNAGDMQTSRCVMTGSGIYSIAASSLGKGQGG